MILNAFVRLLLKHLLGSSTRYNLNKLRVPTYRGSCVKSRYYHFVGIFFWLVISFALSWFLCFNLSNKDCSRPLQYWSIWTNVVFTFCLYKHRRSQTRLRQKHGLWYDKQQPGHRNDSFIYWFHIYASTNTYEEKIRSILTVLSERNIYSRNISASYSCSISCDFS